MGQLIHVVNAGSERDFDAAFAEIMQHKASALFVIADPFQAGATPAGFSRVPNPPICRSCSPPSLI
jgi:hypothetical protein